VPAWKPDLLRVSSVK